MKIFRTATALLLLVVAASTPAQTSPEKIKITGKLVRMMAIGGESTGWAVQLDEPTPFEGKELRSVLVKFNDPKEGEKYVDKKVKVKGTIAHHHGVETGDTVVIDVESIKKLKEPKPAA